MNQSQKKRDRYQPKHDIHIHITTSTRTHPVHIIPTHTDKAQNDWKLYDSISI